MLENEQSIPDHLIEKLAHKIPEIRQRALKSLLSKINSGFTPADLSSCRQLITNIFNWFLFEPSSHETEAVTLLKLIISLPIGREVVHHLGAGTIVREIEKILSFIEPQFHNNLKEILDLIEVPPLRSDLPLSYRSDENVEMDEEEYLSMESRSDSETVILTHESADFEFGWQPLIEGDIKVLSAVENSLSNSVNIKEVQNTCRFVVDVLLNDFPAEVFVQRPGVLMSLYDLLSNPSANTEILNITMKTLFDLTRVLTVRMSQYMDSNLKNKKNEVLLQSDISNKQHLFESPEEIKLLKRHQISPLEYCIKTFNILLICLRERSNGITESIPKLNQDACNNALSLLNSVINLLTRLFQLGYEIIVPHLIHILSHFGDTIEYFRLEFLSLKNNLECRAIYIYLLAASVKLVSSIFKHNPNACIPLSLKMSLNYGLLDIAISELYPQLNLKILDLSEKMDLGNLKRFHEVTAICESMSATLKFLKLKDVTRDNFLLAQASLKSLDIYCVPHFIKLYISFCSEHYFKYVDDKEVVESKNATILALLAHRKYDIRLQSYEECSNIITAIGKYSKMDAEIRALFLLDSVILLQISCFGVIDDVTSEYAKEILHYLLKSRYLLGDDLWPKCVNALEPILPILMCFSDNETSLGRTIFNLVDPDTVKSLEISSQAMLQSNVVLLFSKNALIREEALARLCWLLANQKDSGNLLPKMNTLYDKAVSYVPFSTPPMGDVNKIRNSGHFYEASSLKQIIDVLKSEDLEPVILRSALNQLSVILQDDLMHDVFREASGIELIEDFVNNTLKSGNTRLYPDCIIPLTTILKYLCLYSNDIRQILGLKKEIFFNVLRGLLMFFTEDRMRQDAVTVLFLLAFKDYVVGTPAQRNFSIPALLQRILLVPFGCNSHSLNSPYTMEDLTNILNDKWSLKAIQIHWNAETNEGFNRLMLLNESELLASNSNTTVNDALKLSVNDLMQLKSTSLKLSLETALYNIQNASNYDDVKTALYTMGLYLRLARILSVNLDANDLRWKETFKRFFEALPSSSMDTELLDQVLDVCIIFNDLSWIRELLQNHTHPLFDLLLSSSKHQNVLKIKIFKLITQCVLTKPSGNNCWIHVVKTIIQLLEETQTMNNTYQISDFTHIDAALECLCHITSELGWSQSNGSVIITTDHVHRLAITLCDLLKSVQCGKTLSVSVMGLSLLRHILMILAQLALELENSCAYYKKLEKCFSSLNASSILFDMWESRDVIVRAATLQLFGNLAASGRKFEIFDELKIQGVKLWEFSLDIVINHTDEASIVRENAALLLAHLKIPTNIRTLFEEKLLPELQIILQAYIISQDETIKASCDHNNASTSGLIGAINTLLCKIILAIPKELTQLLLDNGLVKIIFRTITYPSLCLNGDARQLFSYRNIIEMNTSICILLNKLCLENNTCTGTLLYTKDCLKTFLTIFKIKNDLICKDFEALEYLVDALCNEAYRLLAVLLDQDNSGIILDMLPISSNQKFWNGLNNALHSEVTQDSALGLLTIIFCHVSIVNVIDPLEEIGKKFCESCLLIYNQSILTGGGDASNYLKKQLAVAALQSIFKVSLVGKFYALEMKLIPSLVKQLQQAHVKLTLDGAKAMSRDDLKDIIGLLSNLLYECTDAKVTAADVHMPDSIHKLWSFWAMNEIGEVLQLLSIYTLDCPPACKSLLLTTLNPGSLSRKTPGNDSLIQCISTLIIKEMALVSRTRELNILEIALDILGHCSQIIESRLGICKTNLLQCIGKLHPQSTKRQRPWPQVERYWLSFLETLTRYPEGQSWIGKSNNDVEVIITLASNGSSIALAVLRNLSFYAANRTRFLTMAEFLNLLKSRIVNNVAEDRQCVSVITWALVANNQKAKLALKACHFDELLEQEVKRARSSQAIEKTKETQLMELVLEIIRGKNC